MIIKCELDCPFAYINPGTRSVVFFAFNYYQLNLENVLRFEMIRRKTPEHLIHTERIGELARTFSLKFGKSHGRITNSEMFLVKEKLAIETLIRYKFD